MFSKIQMIYWSALFAMACAGVASAHTPGEHHEASPANASTPDPRTTTDAPDATSFGEEMPATAARPLTQALAETPAATGKQLISGRIGKVCQNQGCWMTLHDGDAMVRVETGHRFAIPADASGDAVVFGTLKRSVLDEDGAAHLRSESLDVDAGEAWTIDASGVRILE